MAAKTWIVRHGFRMVSEHRPRMPRKFADWSEVFMDLEPATRRPYGYAPPQQDELEWGPLHVDVDMQRLLRSCYARDGLLDDEACAAAWLSALDRGDRLLFWAHPHVGSCLGILWALDWLHTRGGDLRNSTLVVDTDAQYQPHATTAEFHSVAESGIPVPEVLDALLAVRRTIASDSQELVADVSGLPEPVRSWAALTDCVADSLPDERGLDLMDSLLLDNLTEEWDRGGMAVAQTMIDSGEDHRPGNWPVWQRLVELSDKAALLLNRGAYDHSPLCELEFEGQALMV